MSPKILPLSLSAVPCWKNENEAIGERRAVTFVSLMLGIDGLRSIRASSLSATAAGCAGLVGAK